jgi:hypothetical protein
MCERRCSEVRNTKAFMAWFWVAAATFLFTANSVRNTSMFGPGGKRSSRDRVRWERT